MGHEIDTSENLSGIIVADRVQATLNALRESVNAKDIKSKSAESQRTLTQSRERHDTPETQTENEQETNGEEQSRQSDKGEHKRMYFILEATGCGKVRASVVKEKMEQPVAESFQLWKKRVALSSDGRQRLKKMKTQTTAGSAGVSQPPGMSCSVILGNCASAKIHNKWSGFANTIKSCG